MPLREFLGLLRSSRQQAVEGQQQRRQGGAAPATGEAGTQKAAAAPAAAPAEAASAPAVVPYLQYQNSSLTAEVPQLLGDADPRLSWADEAFGEPAGGSSCSLPCVMPLDVASLLSSCIRQPAGGSRMARLMAHACCLCACMHVCMAG